MPNNTHYTYIGFNKETKCIHLIPSEVPSSASQVVRAPERKNQRTGCDETT